MTRGGCPKKKVGVRKSKSGGWDIVEGPTKKVVGHSETKRKASISASIHTRAHKKKRKKEK